MTVSCQAMRTIWTTLLFCTLARAADAVLPGGNLLSCDTYSYRELLLAGKLDVMDVPALYRREGIRGISLNERYLKSRDDAYVDRFKAATAREGRVVACFVIDGNLALADEAKRREQVAHDMESLRIAHRLGAPTVRINLGATGKAENADDTAGVARVIAAFNQMLPLARDLNIRITIENHGGPSGSADNILRIIKGTDPKWVGALIDFGNFPEALRYSEIAKLAPHAFFVHVKTKDNGAEYDLPRIFRMLKEHNYKAPLSIEFEGRGDPVAGVRMSRELVLKNW